MDFKEKILNKMAALCSRKEYCEADIREKLRKYQTDPADADIIIGILKERQFINEIRYAEAYTKDKFRFNGWGKGKIASMLSSKEIPEEAISHALALIGEDDILEKCIALMQSRVKVIDENDTCILRHKLIRFAAGRGFSMETSYKAAEYVLKKINT